MCGDGETTGIEEDLFATDKLIGIRKRSMKQEKERRKNKHHIQPQPVIPKQPEPVKVKIPKSAKPKKPEPVKPKQRNKESGFHILWPFNLCSTLGVLHLLNEISSLMCFWFILWWNYDWIININCWSLCLSIVGISIVTGASWWRHFFNIMSKSVGGLRSTVGGGRGWL